jgi:hypothetical protein
MARKEPKIVSKYQPRVIMPRMAKIRSSGKFLNLTSSSYNQLAAVVYADVFGFPLTVSEARLWAIRRSREKNSQKLFDQAAAAAAILRKIPTIEAIFLTGSAAAKNAGKNADADLMIVTSPNTLWLTRLGVFLWLRLTRKLKNPLCPNIFLDTNHLAIKERNLFTAHEVLQVKCLYDRGRITEKWLAANRWTKDYLPLPFELLAFLAQYFYQKPKQTNEKLGWGYAFFHPDELSTKVLRKFERRLLKYKGE